MLSLITTVPDTNVLVAIVYSKYVILGEFMSKNKFALEIERKLKNFFLCHYFVGLDAGIRSYFGRTAEGSLSCTGCDYVNMYPNNLRSHIESKHYSPGYKCQFCGRLFKIMKSCRWHEKKCGIQYQ